MEQRSRAVAEGRIGIELLRRTDVRVEEVDAWNCVELAKAKGTMKPVMLYMGFTGFIVPFAFASSAPR